jgi:hypothetical protein
LTARQDAKAEIAKYKASLAEYYKSKGQSYVIFERNVRSQHMQLQVCMDVCVENKSYGTTLSLTIVISTKLIVKPRILSTVLRVSARLCLFARLYHCI